MPLLWRYLLVDYFKAFLLSAVGFIAILLTARLEDIAHFATFGPTLGLIALYVLYQIPYILPIAIPVSCLIAAFSLTQKLSASQELTALRSAGFSLRAILFPVILASTLIAFGNFYVVSEWATDAHLKSNLLKNELRSINPLLLLHNKHLMRLKGIFFDTLGTSKNREKAADIVLALPNKATGGINLLLAKQIYATSEDFTADIVTFVTSLTKKTEGFGELFVENVQAMESSTDDFSHFIQKKVSHVNNDHLNLGLLLIRIKNYWKDTNLDHASLNSAYAEIVRRFSAALSPITFTLMGLVFGIRLSRTGGAKKAVYSMLLAACYLTAFFAAKGLGSKLFLASALYLLPHLLILTLSIYCLNRINRGVV